MKTYNWGIIGAGKIAVKFIEGVRNTGNGKVYAIASRTKQKAEEFAKEHTIAVAYGSYEELVNDPNIDIVYIATPNNMHYENTMLCLQAKKAVLCEKPFALNSAQLEEMTALAKKQHVFLMEALWTRFLPTIEKVQTLINEGAIGEPKIIQADFGFKAHYDANSRLFNKSLGGGSLFDIGIYPIFLSLWLFGKPISIKEETISAETGTDLTTGIIMKHSEDRMSMLISTFAVNLDTEARIIGTEGKITLHRMFHMPTKLSLTKNGITKTVHVKSAGNGYNYEAQEVMSCLDLNKTESEKLPLSFSLELMDILTQIQQHNSHYFG